MNAIRSEVRKVLTTRSTWLLAALVLVVPVLVSQDAGGGASDGTSLWEQQGWLLTALLTRLLFVVLGVRSVTEEHRYGTFTPSVLATGSRTRLLAAKAVVVAGASVLLSVAAQLVLVAAVVWAPADGAVQVTGDDVLAMAGTTVAAALYGALGVGVGAVVRQPVPATAGALFWLLFAEEALAGRLGDAVNWLPGRAGIGLAVLPAADDARHAAVGLALLGWTAAALAAATVLVRRRDVA